MSRSAEPEDAAARLAAIVANADDAIVSKTLDGVITSWNRAAEEMFGYTADEVVGRSITVILPPERLDEEMDILARLRRGEAVEHFETERITKDGRRLAISLSVSPIRNAQGRIIGASKIARDVTERRRAEARVRETVQTLATLYRLADRIGRATGVTDVCDAAVEAIVAAGADRASLLLFDESGVMRFCAWRNLSDGYRAAVDGHSPWSPTTIDPAPIFVEDVRANPAMEPLRAVVSAEGIRALAFVPLVHQGRLLGKFMTYYDTPHAFSERDTQLATTIAQHVALGVARTHAEAEIEALLAQQRSASHAAEAARSEAEHRRQVAERLTRLARDVNESLDVATIGERVVNAAVDLFKGRTSSLRLLTPEGSLVGIAFAGPHIDPFVPGHTIPSGPASLSGLAMAQGTAVWSAHLLTDPRVALADDILRAIRVGGDAAVLAVPLRAKGRILGALSVAVKAGREFSVGDAEMLQGLADQAALAIDNARLYEEARRQQREAELVAELAQRMNASLDLTTTLERLVDGARELCEADIARIVVRDPASGRMVLRHHVGTRWSGYHDDMTIEPGQGSGGFVLTTGKAFRTDHYAEDPRISKHYLGMIPEEGTIAQLVVPIPWEGGIGGLLYVDRRAHKPFTERDEAVLLRLADHAATAIRNTQLFAAERAARAEADDANRGKDRFLAVLSHELRTPLNAMLGWARLVRSARLSEAERNRGIEIMERNARLQARLIADLLDVSRITAGKMEVERVPIDLVFVAREAIETMTADVEAKSLRLDVELDESAGDVFGDAVRLQQVISNLLSNAIKFTPAGGHIGLRLVRHETTARLTITDSGEGIEPALLDRIFDPFEQGDRSTTRKHKGLGLGLAIVRQLVELHGGTIRADSAGPGQGATFTVDLPVIAVRVDRQAGVAEGPREMSAQGERLKACRLLIVDDQTDARDLIAFVLEREGAEVHVAGSVSHAREVLSRHTIDVLVSDLAMPDADGFELIKELRARLRGQATPIRSVALTAHMDLAVRERALASGFDAHAIKPLDPEQIVELVSKLYGR
jgi:PAS domain S-box-containing protein